MSVSLTRGERPSSDRRSTRTDTKNKNDKSMSIDKKEKSTK